MEPAEPESSGSELSERSTLSLSPDDPTTLPPRSDVGDQALPRTRSLPTESPRKSSRLRIKVPVTKWKSFVQSAPAPRLDPTRPKRLLNFEPEPSPYIYPCAPSLKD